MPSFDDFNFDAVVNVGSSYNDFSGWKIYK